MNHFYSKIDSPVGILTLIAENDSLVSVLWPNDNPNRVKLPQCLPKENHPILRETQKQLQEYFQQKRKSFNLPISLKGTTFQQKVWQALQTIPYGETKSYGQLAQYIKSPSASRAVGAANGRNPISIIIPCHRVIGANGKLTGFAGGLDKKAFLLSLEKA